MRSLLSHIILSIWICIGLSHNLAGNYFQQPQPYSNPLDAFRQFENYVISLSDYTMTFSVATEGAVISKIEGTVRVREGNYIELSAEGRYGRQPVNIRFRFDGENFIVGDRTRSIEEPAPEDFQIYFVQGMMRLGLVVNIFRFIDRMIPLYPVDETEHETWAEITYISTGERRFVGNIEAFPFGIRYRSFGEELGEARLWINVAGGLPFRRESTLYLDAGAVQVVEFYGFSR